MQRRHRLTGSKEFKRVRDHGRSWFHPLLVLRAHLSGLAFSRFGFVVGKPIGKAAVRNCVKRRLREAARARLPDIGPGWDVVLIARPSIANAQFAQVAEALDWLLGRAGLCKTAAVLADITE